MIRSLVIKEFWDLRGVIAFGVVIHALLLANLLGMESYEWLPMREPTTLPFPSSFSSFLGLYTIFFAGLMGLVQGLSDGWGQRWLFVLPMPVRGNDWILGKLAFGLSVWGVLGVGTFLLGILIVNIPGVFPAPFEWWMSRTGWLYLAIAPFVYLGGFLSAIRPGSWFGTRLLPLLGSAMGAMYFLENNLFFRSHLNFGDLDYLYMYVPFFVLVYGVMVLMILQACHQRDYP